MKGFIYLIEIAVAAILMTAVLGAFFTIRVKLNWERADLIAIGSNMFNSLKHGGNTVNLLNGDFTEIDVVKPPNVIYGLKITGSPKTDIKVGCAQAGYYNYIDDLLIDTYVNSHWVNFTLENFDISTGIPDYDAVVFVDYTEYSAQKSTIDNYLNNGGVVIGINATDGSNTDFNNIFGLRHIAASGGNLEFSIYNPSQEDIEKYFLGIGFDVTTEWYIWEERWNIVYLGPNRINITRGIQYREVYEGEMFDLPGPFGTFWFKLKKVWPSIRVNIQPLNISFEFVDFTESPDGVEFKDNAITIVKKSGSNQAAMVANGTAIWISDFPRSNEYGTLVKAAIASRNKEWFVLRPSTTKETVAISSFVPLCCDMPETPEFTFILWYKV